MRSAPRLVCVSIPIARRTLVRYARTLAIPDPDDALLALARAVAASPAWEAAPGAALMVRPGSSPLLAVMGRFDGAQEAWLAAQGRTLEAACAHLRFVDHARVEEDCRRLASELADHLGRDELRRARFAAIPRAGFIVLGLVATVLGLDREQLAPPADPGAPLVLLDDCALSGRRCREYLGRYPRQRRIVLAHLYSHPDLRAALRSREPRLSACLAARDLRCDDAADRGAGWSARFLARMDGACWFGRTEPLGFPWGEPDRLIWHPVEQRPALAWRIVPPELCLKNRVSPAGGPLPIQVQPPAAGSLRPAPEVIFGDLDGQVVLHHLRRGECAALDDVASDLWRAVVRHGRLAAAVDELGRVYAVSGGRLKREIAELAERLIDQGFLQRKAAA